MRIGDILTRADSRQRLCARCISQKPSRAHTGDRIQCRHRILEAGTKRRAQADSEKAHLANRARRERLGAAKPSAGPKVLGVRFPSARDQEVHIEQVAQGSSSRSALTLSVVIAGAPSDATRTGRPNLPRLSLAARGVSRCRTSLGPSSFISTLSPGLRFKAFRN